MGENAKGSRRLDLLVDGLCMPVRADVFSSSYTFGDIVGDFKELMRIEKVIPSTRADKVLSDLVSL